MLLDHDACHNLDTFTYLITALKPIKGLHSTFFILYILFLLLPPIELLPILMRGMIANSIRERLLALLLVRSFSISISWPTRIITSSNPFCKAWIPAFHLLLDCLVCPLKPWVVPLLLSAQYDRHWKRSFFYYNIYFIFMFSFSHEKM